MVRYYLKHAQRIENKYIVYIFYLNNDLDILLFRLGRLALDLGSVAWYG